MVVYTLPLEKIRTRYVKKCKYERTNPAIRQWWWKQFAELENYINTPPCKRKESLKTVFTELELKKLEKHGAHFQDNEAFKQINFNFTSSEKNPIIPPLIIKSIGTHKRKSESIEKESCNTRKKYLNNFLNKPFADVRVWNQKLRRYTISDINDVPLILKAQLLEEKKAQDFDDYIKSIQSYTESEIDKDTILDIFEMVHSKDLHVSLKISMKEVSTIPNASGKYLKLEKFCFRPRLFRELNKDFLEEKLQPKSIAFGTMLPKSLRRKRFKENLREKVFKNAKIYNDIETFAAVWRGITDLETTRKFCEFLYHHQEIPAPTYLEEGGFLNYNEMKKKLGPVSTTVKQIKIVKPPTENKRSRSITERSDISDEHIVV